MITYKPVQQDKLFLFLPNDPEKGSPSKQYYMNTESTAHFEQTKTSAKQ